MSAVLAFRPDSDLDRLAVDANNDHRLVRQTGHAMVEHAHRARQALSLANRSIEHGGWLPWLKANCPTISERTAQVYMRIARRWADLTISAVLDKLAGQDEGPKRGAATLP